jgi:hypothetical protein
MDGSAASPGNFAMGSYVNKRVGRKRTTVLQPIGFSASFDPSTNSVRLLPAGRQAFSRGGQITLIAAGLRSSAGAPMAGNAVFNISKGGKSLSRA